MRRIRFSRRIIAVTCILIALFAKTPCGFGQIEVAEVLFVDLDAAHATAGAAVWENQGTLADFERVGNPLVAEVGGATAVTFNSGLGLDAYQCLELAPDGLVGFDPTRTIEVWAFNPAIAVEETLVAWGYRGGPAGTNMSFNYGNHAAYGAIGHWDAPDIGWNNAGGAPEAGRWHHLVYTYDGAETDQGAPTYTTRVYTDGCLTAEFCNEEFLGQGVINTHAGTPIVIAAQIDNAAGGLNMGLRGTLSIGRVRVHDGVLSDDQVLANFETEKDTYIVNEAPEFVSVPSEGKFFAGAATYTARVTARGFPPPTFEAVSPPGATVSADGMYSYNIPSPPPASFVATVRAVNDVGSVEANWTVTRQEPRADIEIAEDLLVDLDAAHPSAGGPIWENQGTMADFEEVGDPVAADVLGVPAVTFNATGVLDAYRSLEPAPDGVIGLNPTRTIEVWVFNPSLVTEETLVAWGYRGGPDGSNMSFNYGTHGAFGAIGHWGGPDIGWNDAGGAPEPGRWHHLVYTFDGAETDEGDPTYTTRVYTDGCLAAEFCNSEFLGENVINTHPGSPIVLAAQINNAAGDLNTGLRGTLSLGRVRVHDGVLSEDQVLANYEAEEDDFKPPVPPEFVQVPTGGVFFAGGTTTYTARVTAQGTPDPTLEALAPPGATMSAAGIYSYDIPDPPPDSFDAMVRASNGGGSVEASWTVTREDLPPAGQIAIAEELVVDLDADDGTAGEEVWENQVAGSPVGDFTRIGEPFFEVIDAEFDAGVFPIGAVTFNSEFTMDAYQSVGNAAPGLVGLNATRSIEVWAYNPDILPEETLVSWGRRGGPNGTNMSFNYGTHALFGAVGHWGGDGPDLGWDDAGGAPEAGQWHHLVYTYDGTTTRVYSDGEFWNSEELGAGAINTYPDHPITLAAQIQNAAGDLNFTDSLHGVLSIARVRVHDGVLAPEEIAHNYAADVARYTGEVIGGALWKTGDVNGDGRYNIADAVAQLGFLFGSGVLPGCFVVPNVTPRQLTPAGLSILDHNGDGMNNIADAVGSLGFLFGSGTPPALGEGCAEIPGDCPMNCP